VTNIDVSNTQHAIAPVVADRLLKLDQVKDIVGLAKTMIYRLVGEGTFPAPCKPGGHASRWSEREVYQWVADCGAERTRVH